MKCPTCSAPETGVTDTRARNDDAEIRRRRRCPACGFRFTTYERVAGEGLEERITDSGAVSPHSCRLSIEMVGIMNRLSNADAEILRTVARRLDGDAGERKDAAA